MRIQKSMWLAIIWCHLAEIQLRQNVVLNRDSRIFVIRPNFFFRIINTEYYLDMNYLLFMRIRKSMWLNTFRCHLAERQTRQNFVFNRETRTLDKTRFIPFSVVKFEYEVYINKPCLMLIQKKMLLNAILCHLTEIQARLNLLFNRDALISVIKTRLLLCTGFKTKCMLDINFIFLMKSQKSTWLNTMRLHLVKIQKRQNVVLNRDARVLVIQLWYLPWIVAKTENNLGINILRLMMFQKSMWLTIIRFHLAEIQTRQNLMFNRDSRVFVIWTRFVHVVLSKLNNVWASLFFVS